MTRSFKAAGLVLVVYSVLVGFSLPARAWQSAEPEAGAADQNALVAEAQELLETIETNIAEISELRPGREELEGEELVLLERRLLNLGLETLADVDALVDNVLEQEQQGLDDSVFRGKAEELVGRLAPVALQRVEILRSEMAELSKLRESTGGEELIKLELQIEEDDGHLNTILEAALNNADHMELLGLPGAAEKTWLSEILTNRAAVAAERIQLAQEQSGALKERLKEKPDDADLQAELTAAESKQATGRANLETTIALLERLEIDTADYQALLIQTSGEITTDILDTDVALGLFQKWLVGLKDWAAESGPRLAFKVFVFLLILFVFHLLARLTRKIVAKTVATSKLGFSLLMQKMFISASGNVVRIIGLLVALSQLGFALGPILAGLGIMGFIVGFALQETLANFAAGMMILIYRPYDVGDMVEAAGVFGKVSAMSMVSTTVLTIDNQTLIVPNGKIWGDVIKNVTAQRVRRVDLVFGISYTDDIPHTEKVLAQILEEHPKVLDSPEPVIKLHNLGDSSVDFVVRPWVNTDDYWDVFWDVTREVKMRFDKEGISIPFPQRDVHYYEERRLSSGELSQGGPTES